VGRGSFPVSIGGDSTPAPRKTAPGKRDAWPEVERAARALNRSNLAIYPVDARGLMVGQQYVGSMMKPELRNPDTSEFATMQMLAERTGGRAFFNNNDLAAALHQAADDARVTYVLGYYASHHDWKAGSGNLRCGWRARTWSCTTAAAISRSLTNRPRRGTASRCSTRQCGIRSTPQGCG